MTIWIIKDIEKRVFVDERGYLSGGVCFDDPKKNVCLLTPKWFSVKGISERLNDYVRED